MNLIKASDFPLGVFGENSEIYCDELIAPGRFTLGNNVSIRASRVSLGHNSRVDYNTSIRALNGQMEEFYLGDESLISFNCQVLLPFFSMGDYSQVFHSGLLSGYKPITIGHNCWIGQGAILNSAERLTIGNNVRMGGCQIWTHVASGELLEGSRFYSEKPVVVEDNVWLMGFGHTVSPGVTLAKFTVVMSGSVVTKSTKPYKTYSGVPAKDITSSLPAWSPLSQDQKIEMLKKFAQEFILQYPEFDSRIHIINLNSEEDVRQFSKLLKDDIAHLIFINEGKLEDYFGSQHTIFDVSKKIYLKQRSDIEIKWIKFNFGYRSRWLPYFNGN